MVPYHGPFCDWFDFQAPVYDTNRASDDAFLEMLQEYRPKGYNGTIYSAWLGRRLPPNERVVKDKKATASTTSAGGKVSRATSPQKRKRSGEAVGKWESKVSVRESRPVAKSGKKRSKRRSSSEGAIKRIPMGDLDVPIAIEVAA